MGKVRFSILEKTPDRILREDMKFKGMTSRGAATGPRQRPFHGSTAAAERGVSVPPASSWYVCVTTYGYASILLFTA